MGRIDPDLRLSMEKREDGFYYLRAGAFERSAGKKAEFIEDLVSRANEVLATGKGRRALNSVLDRILAKTGRAVWRDDRWAPTKLALEVREAERRALLGSKR